MDGSTAQFGRYARTALVVGLVLIGISLAAAAGTHAWTQFFRSYLWAFVFWTGVALGSMAILMLHHLVPGNWGLALRRILESGSKTIFLMAPLALPVLFEMPRLYSWYAWAHPGAHSESIPPFKAAYLSPSFFVVRTIVYFIVWVLFAYLLTKWSAGQDEAKGPDWIRKLQTLSAPGLVLYGFTATFAVVDWVMSLEPDWFSTIYGLMFMVTQALAAMALVTVVVTLLADRKPLADLITPQLLNDFGNLLLTFTMLWAYLSFSQYLIIWAGDLPDEIPWYMSRAFGGWAGVALALIIFHFAAPFVLLLMRGVKRRRAALGALAALLFVMSIVDVYWLTVPAFQPHGPEFHVADWGLLVGIGGLWLWVFLSKLQERPLLPLNDPRLEEALHHE